jgi:hypothetical protein
MSNTEKTEPKTTKTETKSQAQAPANPFAAFTAFDPMSYWNASQQMFRDAMAQAQAHANQMADKYAALDPMGYWSSFRDAMTTARTSTAGYADKLDAQYAEMEQQLVERAHLAVATWAQLANDAINYGARLSTEARKLGADAAKKVANA